jgi:RimJ/RimL family protein N-acetyltransferase
MNLTLRLADESDCKFIYEWRNDPDARNNSRCKEEIPYSEHEVWFKRSLENSDRKIYIGIDNGERIGQVRFDRENSTTAEISVTIDPRKIGKGYGTSLIKEGSIRYLNESGVEIIRAEAFRSNPASFRAFENAGYILVRDFDYHGEQMVELRLSKK